MKQMRNVSLRVGAGMCMAMLTGCISYPSTKLLVTPIGAAGIHSFAPPGRTADELKAARDASQHLARISEADGSAQR